MTAPAYPAHDKNQHRATVRSIQAVRDNIRILRLEPQEPLVFRAGQYIDISFGGLPARSYSIANPPGEGYLDIHIKRGNGDASRYAMDVLQEGDGITFFGPYGDSLYDDAVTGPVLALAGGLGVAPIRAMAGEAAKKGRAAPFVLLWSTADDNEKYLGDDFRAMETRHSHFEFVPVAGGRLADALAARTIPDPGAWTFYVSGPPDMISAMIPLLLAKGADRSKIHYDRHPEAATVAVAP